MNDLINVTIQITEEAGRSKGQYGMILKLKGLDIATGKTNTYTIYETTQTGISAAWKSYNDGALLGQTVQVGYEAKPGVAPDGSPYTSRIIRSINEDIGNGVQNHVNQQKPRTGDSVASQSQSRNFEKEAYEKCCSIWAQGITLESALGHLERGDFWNLFQAIKADGEKRFNTWNQLGEKLKPKEVVAEDIQEMATEMEAADADYIPWNEDKTGYFDERQIY